MDKLIYYEKVLCRIYNLYNIRMSHIKYFKIFPPVARTHTNYYKLPVKQASAYNMCNYRRLCF